MALATLSIDLTANLAKLQEGMDKSQRMLDQLRDKAQSTGSTLAAVFTGTLASSVFEQGITRLLDLFPRLVEGVAAFKDLEDTTGASAVALASMQTAADVSGVSVESLAGFMNKLTAGLGKITDESKGAGQALANLGIPMAEFKALRPDEQIKALSARFNEFEDGVGKTSTAMALFGKSGPQILKFFKEYGDGLDATSKLTAEQITQADAYMDAHAKMQSQLKQTAQVLAVQSLPALDAFKGGLKDGVIAILELKSTGGELAADRSILEFARNGAMAIGTVVETVISAGKVLYAFAGSVKAVWADLKLGASLVTSSPAEIRDYFKNGTGAIAGALADRNKVQAEADKRYADLVTFDGNAITKAVDKSFSTALAAMDKGNQREKAKFDERARAAAAAVSRGALPNITMPDQAAAAAADKTFEKFLARLQKQRALADGELATGAKLGEADRTRITLTEELAGASDKLTASQKARISAEIAGVVGLTERVEAQRELLDAIKKTTGISDKQLEAAKQETASRIEGNEALRNQVEEFGKATYVVDDLRIARLQHKLALEEEALAMLQNAGASQQQVAAAEQNVALMRQQIELQQNLAAKVRALATDPQAGASKAVEDFLQNLNERGKAVYDAAKGSADSFADDLAASLKNGRLDVSKTVDYMISQFLRLRVVDPLMKSLFGDGGAAAGFFAKIFGGLFANGGAFGQSAPIPFAAGGVFNSPHLFKFANGGAMATGVLGEAGPEAIMPLMRGANGKLGVQVHGRSGGGGIVIQQNNHFASGVNANELGAALEANKRATIAAVLDAQRRGDRRYMQA